MRLSVITLFVAMGVAIPVAALAGDREAGGAAAGAATGAGVGAAVGGPPGAAVGAGVGGVVGAAATPKKVREYVTRDERPSVAYEGEVVVGKPLPQSVEVYSVPDSDYSYTVVNKKRYIVNSQREVVEVVE